MRDSQQAAELQKWDTYFAHALLGKGQENEQTAWSTIADADALSIVAEIMAEMSPPFRIAEAGCGSGEMSFLLANVLPVQHLALFDLSSNALALAASRMPASLRTRTHLLQADIVNLPSQSGKYDLCWNVGVIEHYELQMLTRIVLEMYRVVKPGGVLICAIPNSWSLSARKAWFLGSQFGRQFLRWVPGYRFDTEILYKNEVLAERLQDITGAPVEVKFAGSPLWFNAPYWAAIAARKLLGASRFCFLSFFIIKKPRRNATQPRSGSTHTARI